ncbi:MAG: nickel-responsive transcriptional regulator NikR [Candidatus Hodarchaeales archaeon]|jgi:CopG family nickel-responsive transcriptional regulator
MNSKSNNSTLKEDSLKNDQLQRFSFTLQNNLIDDIDRIGKSLNMNRSMVVREALSSWINNRTKVEKDIHGEGVALTSYMYDHHDTRVLSDLMHTQHEYEGLISSSTHVHLSHTKCFEIVILKGDLKSIKELNNKLRGVKGISSLSEVFIPG